MRLSAYVITAVVLDPAFETGQRVTILNDDGTVPTSHGELLVYLVQGKSKKSKRITKYVALRHLKQFHVVKMRANILPRDIARDWNWGSHQDAWDNLHRIRSAQTRNAGREGAFLIGADIYGDAFVLEGGRGYILKGPEEGLYQVRGPTKHGRLTTRKVPLSQLDDIRIVWVESTKRDPMSFVHGQWTWNTFERARKKARALRELGG